MFKLDRTKFAKKSFAEADNDRQYWLTKSYGERWKAAWYLSCMAYGLDPNENHKLDRTKISKRKRE
jgi:hypothetical protein